MYWDVWMNCLQYSNNPIKITIMIDFLKTLLSIILTIICISSCKNDFYFEPADVKAYKLAPFSVCYIDVGQGDCSLIQCGGEYMLIDSGEDEYYHVLNSYIDLFGVDSFKYVIITHPHSDHMGGMNEVMENVVVRNSAPSTTFAPIAA